jgi:hypothetical protein
MTSPGLSYEDYLRSKKDEEQDDFSYEAYLRQKPRGLISEFSRGLATGGAQAVTTTGEVFGVGRGSTEAVEEYFDPRGTAGRAGQVIGRIGGEIGTSILGGGLLLKGAKAIPKAAKALEGMSAARRALAVGAIQAPVDIVQGAKEEKGMLLPGRAGSIVESVALGQVGPALQARRAAREAREAAAKAAIETRPSRLLPSRSSTLGGKEQYDSPLGPAIPMGAGRVERPAELRPERLLSATARRIEGAQSYDAPAGPAIPMPSGLGVDPDEATRRIAAAAAQAGIDVPKPLIEVVESSARGSQPFRYDARNKTYRLYGTNRTQARYLQSIEETADKLDKEATRLRAFQEPDMDAVAQLEAAAEAGRRMRDALSPGGLIARPGAVSGELLAQGGGALVGGLTGATTADSEDPADVLGRAALGAAAGFGLGRGAKVAPTFIRRMVRPANVPITDPTTKKLLAVYERANPKVSALADEFMGGATPRPLQRATTLDLPFTAQIANWYDSAISNPNDPAVREAYRAFADETRQQYEFLRSKGITFEFVDADPYKRSADMMRDIAENNRLKVLKTEAGMHPLLSEEENDMFRAVHDFFGHAKEGHQFGQLGEENAYRIHSAMYSPSARRVMATETRGQNSWVNNQPANKVKPGSIYAEQKVALMPEEFMGEYPIERVTPEVVTNVEFQSKAQKGFTNEEVKNLKTIERQLGRAAFIRKVVEPIVRDEGLPVTVAKGLGSWMSQGDLDITEAARLQFSNMSPMAIQRALSRVSQAAKQAGFFFSVPDPNGPSVAVTLDFGKALRELDYKRAVERLTRADDGRLFNGTTMVKLDPAKVQIVLKEGVDEAGAENLLRLARQTLPQYNVQGAVQRVKPFFPNESDELNDAFSQYFDRIGYLTPEQAQVQQRAITSYEQLAQAGPTRRAMAAGAPALAEAAGELGYAGLRRVAEMGTRQAALSGGRAGLGALAGIATTPNEAGAQGEEGERSGTSALLGRAAVGAAAALGLGVAARKLRPGVSRLAEALRRGELDRQTVIEGRMRKAGSVGEAKLFEPTISPAVAQLVDEQATQVEKELAAAGVFRESKSLKDMAKEGERFLNSLAPGARTIMTDEEFAGRAARIGRREDALSQVTAKMGEGGLSSDDMAFLQDAHKRIFNAIVADAEVVQPALSSAGRRMNIARQMGARDVRSALNTAKSLLDIPAGAELSDAVKEQIRAVFARPQAEQGEALQRVYQAIAKRTIWEQVTNSRVVGLLSTPATWLVNIFGSAAEAAQNAVAHPVALALDTAYSKATGARRTVAGLSRGKDWLDSFVASGKRVGNPKALRNMLDGIPADSVYGNLERVKGSYVTDWGLQNPGATPEAAESAFRKTARLGARTLDVISNGIFGVMETADIPFYRAALATNLKERAALRALNEGLGNNPEAFAKRVQELLTPDGTNVVDQMLATADALDATYKSTTGAGQAIRALEQNSPVLGGAVRFMVPFANTPTNIIRKALEGIPGVGTAMTAAQNKRLASKMKRLGATAEQVSDEMRRRYITNLARQATTGAGGIAAGFALHQAGVLTPGYAPSRGATPEEREEAQRQRMTGEAPLAIRIGDTSMSLGYLGTLAPALAIGAAMSQAVKDDAEQGIGTVVAPAAKATYRTFLDMPLLKGVSGLVEIGQQGLERLPVELGKQAASFVPSAVAAVARGIDPLQRARPETFGEALAERIPGLRERLAPEPGPFGEQQESMGLVRSLIDPTRPRRVRTGGIYDQLEQLELYPGQRARREGESAQQYAARRAYEGEREQQVLEDILTGRSQGLRSVSASARRNFRRTVEEQGEEEAVRKLLAIALREQRARMTAEDKQFAERQARREGYRRNTEAFKARVKQIEAGQP